MSAQNNKVRPARRLLEVSGKCSKEGMAYGQCVLSTYSTIAPNSCQQEFEQFKACITKNLNGKKW